MTDDRVQYLVPLLKRAEMTLDETPFTVEDMVDLLHLLNNQIINGIPLKIIIIVDGAKLLMKKYLPPNEPPICLPSQHKFLETLTNRDSQNEQLRQKVIQIVSTTPIQERLRDGRETLE